MRNFTQIYKQLRNEQIRSMAMILEATDSAYFPCFSTTFKNVVTGNHDKTLSTKLTTAVITITTNERKRGGKEGKERQKKYGTGKSI